MWVSFGSVEVPGGMGFKKFLEGVIFDQKSVYFRFLESQSLHTSTNRVPTDNAPKNRPEIHCLSLINAPKHLVHQELIISPSLVKQFKIESHSPKISNKNGVETFN